MASVMHTYAMLGVEPGIEVRCALQKRILCILALFSQSGMVCTIWSLSVIGCQSGGNVLATLLDRVVVRVPELGIGESVMLATALSRISNASFDETLLSALWARVASNLDACNAGHMGLLWWSLSLLQGRAVPKDFFGTLLHRTRVLALQFSPSQVILVSHAFQDLGISVDKELLECLRQRCAVAPLVSSERKDDHEDTNRALQIISDLALKCDLSQ